MGSSQPPPEKADAVRNRAWIIYSFWAVIFFLGVPTWWQTTSITRAALPLQDMLSWSDTPDTRPRYVVPVRLSAPGVPCEVAFKIVGETETLLNQESASWGFETSVELVRFSASESAGQRKSGPDCHVREAVPSIKSISLDIELRPGTSFDLDVSSGAIPAVATYSTQDVDAVVPHLAEGIRRALLDEQAAVSYQYHNLGRTESGLSDHINSLSNEMRASIGNNAARAFKPSPDYHLTFSLFTSGGYPSRWDIDTALDQHIYPLVHALAASVNISIATQIQLYSAFSPSIQPYQDEHAEGWVLRTNDLTAFVNTAEWPLSPSVGSGPTINFVLYIPSKHQTPLRVEGKHDEGVLGGSWIVPQWGGITILNAPIVRNDPDVNREDVIAHLTLDLLKPAFDVFQTQLLALLGVPTSTSISLPLRLSAYQRLLALSLHLRTNSNLGSLARLAQHLSNIPIPKHVSDLVHHAMDSLKAYRTETDESKRIAAANSGYKASEKAFFDKSMVGQVYFPDEHKVAVYLPLLGPISVPLIVGLIREMKTLAARLKGH